MITGVLATREDDGQQDRGKAKASGQEQVWVILFAISLLVFQIKPVKDLMGCLMHLKCYYFKDDDEGQCQAGLIKLKEPR